MKRFLVVALAVIMSICALAMLAVAKAYRTKILKQKQLNFKQTTPTIRKVLCSLSLARKRSTVLRYRLR